MCFEYHRVRFHWKEWVKIFTFAYGQGWGGWPPPPYGQPDRKIFVFYAFPYTMNEFIFSSFPSYFSSTRCTLHLFQGQTILAWWRRLQLVLSFSMFLRRLRPWSSPRWGDVSRFWMTDWWTTVACFDRWFCVKLCPCKLFRKHPVFHWNSSRGIIFHKV